MKLMDLAERTERLEEIEQAAKALFANVQKVELQPGVFVITFRVEGKYVEALGTALYGEDDPRVKELKDG